MRTIHKGLNLALFLTGFNYRMNYFHPLESTSGKTVLMLKSYCGRFLILHFILLLYAVFPILLYAQKSINESNSTRSIRDLYEYVQDKISRNQYYVNEYKINSSNLKWVDTEDFQLTQSYYYSYSGDDQAALRYIVVESRKKKVSYLREFLYDMEGKLVLALEKQNDNGQLPYREITSFYEKGLCINLIVDKNLIDSKEKGYDNKLKELLELGTYYAEKFLKLTNVSKK